MSLKVISGNSPPLPPPLFGSGERRQVRRLLLPVLTEIRTHVLGWAGRLTGSSAIHFTNTQTERQTRERDDTRKKRGKKDEKEVGKRGNKRTNPKK